MGYYIAHIKINLQCAYELKTIVSYANDYENKLKVNEINFDLTFHYYTMKGMVTYLYNCFQTGLSLTLKWHNLTLPGLDI